VIDRPSTTAGLRRTRLLLTAALAIYGVPCLVTPEAGRWLDAVDLAIHETGHLVFAPFGEFFQFLGGTLFQLIVPATFVVYFWRRADRHAATVAVWWVAQNCWNVSIYVNDARTQSLPLVGGGEHDWAYLLGRLGWLAYDHVLAGAVRWLGATLYAYAVLGGMRYASQLRAVGPGVPDAA
jgi:hypothetical protein